MNGGCLAGAIGTQKTQNLARLKVKRNVVDSSKRCLWLSAKPRKRFKALGKALNTEWVIIHGHPNVRQLIESMFLVKYTTMCCFDVYNLKIKIKNIVR